MEPSADCPESRRAGTCAVEDPEKSHHYIVLNVNNRNIQCLVDSDASNSIISDKLADNLRLKIDYLMSTGPFVAATGQRLCNLGNDTKVVHSFVVVKDLFPIFLVGVDFLQKISAVIDYSNNTVTFYDGLITIFFSVFIG